MWENKETSANLRLSYTGISMSHLLWVPTLKGDKLDALEILLGIFRETCPEFWMHRVLGFVCRMQESKHQTLITLKGHGKDQKGHTIIPTQEHAQCVSFFSYFCDQIPEMKQLRRSSFWLVVWRNTIRQDGEDTAAYGSRSPHMPAEQEEEMGPEVEVCDRKIQVFSAEIHFHHPDQTSWGFFNLSEQN